MRNFIFLFCALVMATGLQAQDFHVEASRLAVVHAQPVSTTASMLRLARGEQLNCVTGTQRDGYYNVQLPDGRSGWVSRYVVRLYRGPATAAPGAGSATDAVPSGVTGSAMNAASGGEAFHLAIGRPKGYEVLVREGYVSGYDPRLKIPVWVQYRLTEERSDDDSFPRTNSFDDDAAIPATGRAMKADYDAVGADYVLGHMAPADDMRWSVRAEAESNLLTNIAPQIGTAYNGSVWLRIENRVRSWASRRDDITVICGPVFGVSDLVRQIDGQPPTTRQVLYNVIGARNVAVPSAFFKIVVDMTNPENPDVIAFMVPHKITTEDEREIGQYITTVDEIEKRTGLDFLSSVPTAAQDRIESTAADLSW